ncbi:hypothetical protein, partial [Endozoicomonas sp. ALE010]|uniref:hypothetical protein n=1 Tax=Endozoicomonas sp. ALE010 TaxID=3403081 RepID=UPI003BB4B934
MMKVADIKVIGQGLILITTAMFLLTGCNAMKYYNFVVQNDSDTPIYELRVLSVEGREIYPIYRNASRPINIGHTAGTVSLSMRELPEYVLIEWKNIGNGTLLKKKLDLKKMLPKNFWGGVVFSVLENRDVEVSWKLRGGESERYIDCGGYIFEKYYYRAKPKIDKNIADWQSYLKQKEADLKAGLTDKYKKPKYY